MIHVQLSGSPYEMGYQHGQVLRALVDGMVRYESRCHAHVLDRSFQPGAVLNRVYQFTPELIEELRGIADGAQVSFELLLQINLRVLHYCTVIAFVHSERGPLLGKNLDFPVYAYQALFTVQPDDGYAFTHIGCAGSVASYGGINTVGLAMGHAAVPLENASDSGGLPVAFLRRHALQYSATTKEAVALVSQYDSWRMGDNLLFLDRHGEAAIVEKRPGKQSIRRAKDGAVEYVWVD